MENLNISGQPNGEPNPIPSDLEAEGSRIQESAATNGPLEDRSVDLDDDSASILSEVRKHRDVEADWNRENSGREGEKTQNLWEQTKRELEEGAIPEGFRKNLRLLDESDLNEQVPQLVEDIQSFVSLLKASELVPEEYRVCISFEKNHSASIAPDAKPPLLMLGRDLLLGSTKLTALENGARLAGIVLHEFAHLEHREEPFSPKIEEARADRRACLEMRNLGLDMREYIAQLEQFPDRKREPAFTQSYIRALLAPHPANSHRISACQATLLDEDRSSAPRQVGGLNQELLNELNQGLQSIQERLRHFEYRSEYDLHHPEQDLVTRVSSFVEQTDYLHEGTFEDLGRELQSGVIQGLYPSEDLDALADMLIAKALASIEQGPRVEARGGVLCNRYHYPEAFRWFDLFMAFNNPTTESPEKYLNFVDDIAEEDPKEEGKDGDVAVDWTPSLQYGELKRCNELLAIALGSERDADSRIEALDELALHWQTSRYWQNSVLTEELCRYTDPLFSLAEEREREILHEIVELATEAARNGREGAAWALLCLGVTSPKLAEQLSDSNVLEYKRFSSSLSQLRSSVRRPGDFSSSDEILFYSLSYSGLSFENSPIGEIPQAKEERDQNTDRNNELFESMFLRQTLVSELVAKYHRQDLSPSEERILELWGSYSETEHSPQLLLDSPELYFKLNSRFIAENREALVEKVISIEEGLAARDEEFPSSLKQQVLASLSLGSLVLSAIHRMSYLDRNSSEEKEAQRRAKLEEESLERLMLLAKLPARSFGLDDKLAAVSEELGEFGHQGDLNVARVFLEAVDPKLFNFTVESWPELTEKLFEIRKACRQSGFHAARNYRHLKHERKESSDFLAVCTDIFLETNPELSAPSLRELRVLPALVPGPHLRPHDARSLDSVIRGLETSPVPDPEIKEVLSFMHLTRDLEDPFRFSEHLLTPISKLSGAPPQEVLLALKPVLRSSAVFGESVRETIADTYAGALVASLGRDDGSLEYSRSFVAAISNLESDEQSDLVRRILKKTTLGVVAQEECSDAAKELLTKIETEEFRGRYLEEIIGTFMMDSCQEDPEFRRLCHEFLEMPFGGVETKKLHEYLWEKSDRVVYSNEAESVVRKGQQKRRILSGLRYMHQQYWSSGIEKRALFMRQIALPVGSDAEGDIRKSLVRFFDGLEGEKKRNRQRAAEFGYGYIAGLEPAKQALSASALLGSRSPYGEASARIGQVAAATCGPLGPLQRKSLQIAHSLPDCDPEFRRDVAHSKYKMEEIPRWALWKSIREQLPERVRESFDSVNHELGNASFFQSVEVAFGAGEILTHTEEAPVVSGVLQMLKPASELLASEGEVAIGRGIAELRKAGVDTSFFEKALRFARESARTEIAVEESAEAILRMSETYGGITLREGQRSWEVQAPVLLELRDYGALVGESWRVISKLPGMPLTQFGFDGDRDTYQSASTAIALTELCVSLSGRPFNADAHGGNWLVAPESGVLSRIDAGEMLEKGLSPEVLSLLGTALGKELRSYRRFFRRNIDVVAILDKQIRKYPRAEAEILPLYRQLVSLSEYLPRERTTELFVSALPHAHPAFTASLGASRQLGSPAVELHW